MNIAIVGHGPSMVGSKLGETIDGNDVVIRLKRMIHLLKDKEDFGSRYDIGAGSLRILPMMKEMLQTAELKVPLMCLFDSRDKQLDQAQVNNVLAQCQPYEVYADRELCDELDKLYMVEVDKDLDFEAVTHTSQGTKAAWLTANSFPRSTINLYGFDNVRDGTFNWSLTRGPEWDKYPNHRWDIEHRMIPMIAQMTGSKINVH